MIAQPENITSNECHRFCGPQDAQQGYTGTHLNGFRKSCEALPNIWTKSLCTQQKHLRGKFDTISNECILSGTLKSNKLYRLWYPEEKNFITSKHAKFVDEFENSSNYEENENKITDVIDDSNLQSKRDEILFQPGSSFHPQSPPDDEASSDANDDSTVEIQRVPWKSKNDSHMPARMSKKTI
ncbi:hypothetical protein CDAR_549491 [Caerostris darwini]|uniref:Retroviral polymerase SH3-like domain-containing protein n=1 Tax=Caerostris darwini TaxID=1538125 RepID=A0AAV4QF86_9ARAC|nr:hypothetical protein CDAR_549491 [Caerostris darwini]